MNRSRDLTAHSATIDHSSESHTPNLNHAVPGTEYDQWRSLSVGRLKDKLKANVKKRRERFQDVVTNAARRLSCDDHCELELMPNIAAFRISSTIMTEAVDRMCATIDSWPGVHLSQCKKPPREFKKYWRIADNWWSRQKGRFFGDLFFWPILHHSLHSHCRRMLKHHKNELQSDYLFYIFLCDILHAKVSFKKARPNPLIFDLALEKSPELQQWFSIAGDRHGVPWQVTSATNANSNSNATKISSQKQSIGEYAQDWVQRVKDKKYFALQRFQSVNDPEMEREKKRRNSSSMSISDREAEFEESESEQAQPPKKSNTPTVEMLQQMLQQERAQHAAEMDQMYREQLNTHYLLQQQAQAQAQQTQFLFQQQQHQQQQFQYQLMSRGRSALVKEEESVFYQEMDQSIHQSINQPAFLPPPRNVFMGYTPPQRTRGHYNPPPLPPPLKTGAGRERRQSYHEVLRVKQFVQQQQQQAHLDEQKQSVASGSLQGSQQTSASYTTVPATLQGSLHMGSTPSVGSEYQYGTPRGHTAHARQRSYGYQYAPQVQQVHVPVHAQPQPQPQTQAYFGDYYAVQPELPTTTTMASDNVTGNSNSVDVAEAVAEAVGVEVSEQQLADILNMSGHIHSNPNQFSDGSLNIGFSLSNPNQFMELSGLSGLSGLSDGMVSNPNPLPMSMSNANSQ